VPTAISLPKKMAIRDRNKRKICVLFGHLKGKIYICSPKGQKNPSQMGGSMAYYDEELLNT
jgi:hypothetical protein